MQWDTHYGSSILKPKPETSLFFGGIKWLSTVLFRFFVENQKNLLLVHIEKICNLNSCKQDILGKE